MTVLCHQIKQKLTGFNINFGSFGLIYQKGIMPGGRWGWFISLSILFKRFSYFFGYYSYLKYCEWKFKKYFNVVFNRYPPVIQTVSFGYFRLTRFRNRNENSKEGIN
jgi:hypothetical protein